MFLVAATAQDFSLASKHGILYASSSLGERAQDTVRSLPWRERGVLQSISQAWLPGFYLDLSLRRLGTWRQSRTTASRRERTSFYRFKELYDKGGEAALIELSRQRLNIRNRAAAEVEQAVLGLAVEQPA